MTQKTGNIDIQDWANENEPSDYMSYKKGFWNQIVFVRDTFPELFADSYKEACEIRETIQVTATHVSKLINLPVTTVLIDKLGVSFTLRNDFHDWIISVKSKKPITIDFGDLISNRDDLVSIYCGGFDQSVLFPHYQKGNTHFTVSVKDNYKLFTFLWLIKQFHLKN